MGDGGWGMGDRCTSDTPTPNLGLPSRIPQLPSPALYHPHATPESASRAIPCVIWRGWPGASEPSAPASRSSTHRSKLLPPGAIARNASCLPSGENAGARAAPMLVSWIGGPVSPEPVEGLAEWVEGPVERIANTSV